MTRSTDAITILIPAELKILVYLGEQLRKFLAPLDRLEEPEIMLYNIELAVQEIAANIVKHAYATSTGQILMSAKLSSEYESAGGLTLTITMEDNGVSFDPAKVSKPRPDELQEHGFGLFLVQHLMDEVEYGQVEGKNIWKLVKMLPVRDSTVS